MNEREIFAAARQLSDVAEQNAFLDKVCAGDQEQRRRIVALLEEQAHLGSFLEHDEPTARTLDQAGTQSPGTVIGPYKLLEQLGEGGMGTVWMALQTEPVKRVVALKLIKAGMDSKQVIARFEAERQALALMDHPNIAKVLDAGATGAGRPYFVMDLVKGVPITKYCDEHHLTPRQRLELVIPVCQAVQHAHQKGIIHRDLKPSNVLVALYDGKPVPKVIDFGVAKATRVQLTDATLITGFGNIVGTLEYMSPEQAEVNQLDIDTRSDIYSLGVLLYELLAGAPPFSRKDLAKAGMLEMLRFIREQEPSKPSTKLSTAEGLPTLAANRGTEPAKLTKLIRGELDWIVMKALEKDRNRRYETANGFAMDLQRFLADEPVLAGPPSARYRLRKFVRRHRAPVIAAALIVTTLIGGVLGTTLGLLRALQAEREAVQAKQDAEKNLGQAIKAADTFFTRVSESKLLDKPALQAFRKELLEEAQKHYRELFNRKPDDVLLKAELASSYLRTVLVLTSLEAGDEAVAALEKGLDLIEPLVNAHPHDVELARRLAGICTAERPVYRGWLDGYSRCEMPHGATVFERACRAWEKLANNHPAIPALQGDYATLLACLGDIHRNNGHVPECRHAYERANTVFAKLLREPTVSCEHRINAALARQIVAGFERQRGRQAEAIAGLREVVAMSEQLIGEFPNKPVLLLLLVGAQYDLAELLEQSGSLAEAEAELNEAIQSALRLRSADTAVPAFWHALAHTHRNKGSCLRALGRFQDAEASIRRGHDFAAEAARQFPEIFHSQLLLGQLKSQLAGYLMGRNQREQATSLFEQALVIIERIEPQAPPERQVHVDLHELRTTLSNLLASNGRVEEAKRLRNQAMASAQKLLKNYPDVPLFHVHVAQCYEMLGRWDQAVAVYSNAIGKWPNTLQLWSGRENAYRSQGKRDAARADSTKMIELLTTKDEGPSNYYNRMTIYDTLGKDEKALGELAAATERWPQLWETWFWRGQFFFQRQKWELAIADYSKALRLNENHCTCWHHRGIAHMKLKQWDQAIVDQTKAIELNSEIPEAVYQRGFAYANLNQWNVALTDYAKVLELDLSRAVEMVEFLQSAKRSADAEKLLRSAIAMFGKLDVKRVDERNRLYGLGQSAKLLAHLLSRTERHQEAALYFAQAIEVFSRLVKAEPWNAGYHNELARTHYDVGCHQRARGENEKAERNVRQAITYWLVLASDQPNTPEYRIYAAETIGIRAALLFGMGRRQEAKDITDQVVEQWPNLAHARIARGRISLALQQADKALADFTQAIELAPKDGAAPWWHYERANAYVALKRHGDALAELTKVTERWPKLFDVWAWRGWLHRDLGQLDKAVADYSKAVELNPSWWPGYFDRALASVKLKMPDQAVADLRESLKHGLPNAAQTLKTEAGFESLRSREDFTALLSDLEKKK